MHLSDSKTFVVKQMMLNASLLNFQLKKMYHEFKKK